MLNFDYLLGKTILHINGDIGDNEIKFTLSNGYTFILYHEQDCCESVEINDITGDLNDLVGHPLLFVEESINDRDNENIQSDYEHDSVTWTFYKLATKKGWVDLRWLGESNGYYSESVDIRLEKNK